MVTCADLWTSLRADLFTYATQYGGAWYIRKIGQALNRVGLGADVWLRNMLRQFRAQGYEVLLYFLWLPEVAMNIARVAQRVREGGHDVPEQDVRRRYRRGIVNFLKVYRPLADAWIVFDNSAAWPREVAFALSGEVTILDEEAFQAFIKAGEEP